MTSRSVLGTVGSSSSISFWTARGVKLPVALKTARWSGHPPTRLADPCLWQRRNCRATLQLLRTQMAQRKKRATASTGKSTARGKVRANSKSDKENRRRRRCQKTFAEVSRGYLRVSASIPESVERCPVPARPVPRHAAFALRTIQASV